MITYGYMSFKLTKSPRKKEPLKDAQFWLKCISFGSLYTRNEQVEFGI